MKNNINQHIERTLYNACIITCHDIKHYQIINAI